MAAYRPVLYRVAASRTGGGPVPPVVFCDIYFNGTYYKSLSKTQYEQQNTTDSEFEFDIADAAQEYLKHQPLTNGGSVILEASNVFTQCYCRFRSSGFDSNGFLIPEDTAPIQGTGSQLPVAGTGTDSDTCTIINAALQHEDNQDLSMHLAAHKTNLDWQESALPLTHRPATYKVCPGDSDYFPYIDTEAREPKCIRLSYRLKGQSGFTTVQWCKPCVPLVALGAITLPNAMVGQPYSYSFGASSETAIEVIDQGKPSWMIITITQDEPTAYTVTITGTPPEGSDEENVFVGFDLTNCGGAGLLAVDQHITVYEEGTCLPITLLALTIVGDDLQITFNAGAWAAVTVQFSPDGTTWSNNSTGAPVSPRLYPYALLPSGSQYLRLIGHCTGGINFTSSSLPIPA